MDRDAILESIKTQMIDTIKVSNGYNITPVVILRGVYSYNDVKDKVPALCFTFTTETPYEDDQYPKTYNDTDIKAMAIMFYGYAHHASAGDNKKIYDMIHDLETFLQSEAFTYHNKTNTLSLEVKEAGNNDPVLSFILAVNLIINDDIE